MKKLSFVTVAALAISLAFQSCNNSANSVSKDKKREAVLEEVEKYQEQLPFEVPGSGMVVTDIDLYGDIVAFTYQVDTEYAENKMLPEEEANSDKNIARVISNMGSDIELYIENELGIRYTYISAETNEVLMKIYISPEKLKEIYQKMEDGTIQAYSFLELSQIELDNVDLPIEMEDGMSMIDCYIRSSNIFYVFQFDYEIDRSDVTTDFIDNIKQTTINNLKEVWAKHKKEIIKKDINFTYIYKNSRNIEIARYVITPEDFVV